MNGHSSFRQRKQLDMVAPGLDRHERLVASLRPYSGVVTGSTLALHLASRHRQPVAQLARWIVSRDLLCFEWENATWVPLFQFDAHFQPRAVVRDVADELTSVLDDLTLIEWFVEPNHWLGERPPVEVMMLDASSVSRAARFDCAMSRI